MNRGRSATERRTPTYMLVRASIEALAAVLTERERQVMQLVCERRSNEDIERRLKLSDGAARAYIHCIYQKLAAANRAGLSAMARSANTLHLMVPLVCF